MNGPSGFVDDIWIGVLKKFSEQGRLLPNERQCRESGLGAGFSVSGGEQGFGGLRSGESADQAMTKPRQLEVSICVLKESVERDFSAQLTQGKAGLDAHTEIFMGELRGGLGNKLFGRLGLAQYLQRLHAYLAVGVFQ